MVPVPYIFITIRQLFMFVQLTEFCCFNQWTASPWTAIWPCPPSPSCFMSSWTLCWNQLLLEQLDAVLTPAVSGAAGRCAGSSCFRSSWTLCWLQLFQEQLDAVLAPAVSGAAERCAGPSCFKSSWTLCWTQLFQEQLDAVLTPAVSGAAGRCAGSTFAGPLPQLWEGPAGLSDSDRPATRSLPDSAGWKLCQRGITASATAEYKLNLLWLVPVPTKAKSRISHFLRVSESNTGERMRIRSDAKFLILQIRWIRKIKQKVKKEVYNSDDFSVKVCYRPYAQRKSFPPHLHALFLMGQTPNCSDPDILKRQIWF